MKTKLLAIAFGLGMITSSVRTSPLMATDTPVGLPSSKAYFETEIHFQAPRTWYLTESQWIASDTEVEAELVFAKGRINTLTKTRLGVDVEILLSNPQPVPDAAAIDAVIRVGTTTCSFTNDPRLTGPFALGSQSLYKVEFHGAVSQYGTSAAASKGLDCGGSIPHVLLGEIATVDISGLPLNVVPSLSGKFAGE